MLGISRRLDNEHGHRIDSITKPHLNRKYHPNRGHRHVTMSHPKHGTQVGNSQMALSSSLPLQPTLSTIRKKH